MIADSQTDAVGADEYNADRSTIRNTTKEIFRRSRKQFYELCVAKTTPWPEPTEALNLGIWTHIAVWEPDRWLRNFVVAPKCDRRTTEGKAVWKYFCEESAGKTVLTAEQYDEVMQLREAVMANKMARALVEAEGKHEHTLAWTDEGTGLPCKCRDDKLMQNAIVDLKTTRDGVSRSEFRRMAASRGLHRNAEFYVAGHHTALGERLPYLFLVVSKATRECACYELDDSAMTLGWQQNQSTLRNIARCYESGDWCSDHEKQIVTVSLPRWAASDDDETGE